MYAKRRKDFKIIGGILKKQLIGESQIPTVQQTLSSGQKFIGSIVVVLIARVEFFIHLDIGTLF
jgi:hypothetical protein